MGKLKQVLPEDHIVGHDVLLVNLKCEGQHHHLRGMTGASKITYMISASS